MIINDNIGKLVQYYNNGYRVGYLVGFVKKKQLAIIQPIGAINGKCPHKIKVPVNDIEIIK